MSYRSINLQDKFARFNEPWQPKVIAEMNEYQFKVVRLQGDIIWHNHKETDETFIVVEGDLRSDFRDGAVHVSTGEMFVVPKGVEHWALGVNARSRRGVGSRPSRPDSHRVGLRAGGDPRPGRPPPCRARTHALGRAARRPLGTATGQRG